MKRSISIPTDTLWQAGFLLLTPFTAAWLMQFTYGVLPWAMLFPALLANALCIALLYWPLCGLTGKRTAKTTKEICAMHRSLFVFDLFFILQQWLQFQA